MWWRLTTAAHKRAVTQDETLEPALDALCGALKSFHVKQIHMRLTKIPLSDGVMADQVGCKCDVDWADSTDMRIGGPRMVEHIRA